MKQWKLLGGSRIASQADLKRNRPPPPRVPAVKKKPKPPRRLPSPATERARDLKRALTKQGQPLYPRARNLNTALKQGQPLYLGARIFRQPSSRDTKTIFSLQGSLRPP